MVYLTNSTTYNFKDEKLEDYDTLKDQNFQHQDLIIKEEVFTPTQVLEAQFEFAQMLQIDLSIFETVIETAIEATLPEFKESPFSDTTVMDTTVFEGNAIETTQNTPMDINALDVTSLLAAFQKLPFQTQQELYNQIYFDCPLCPAHIGLCQATCIDRVGSKIQCNGSQVPMTCCKYVQHMMSHYNPKNKLCPVPNCDHSARPNNMQTHLESHCCKTIGSKHFIMEGDLFSTRCAAASEARRRGINGKKVKKGKTAKKN